MGKTKYRITKNKTGETIEVEGTTEAAKHFGVTPGALYYTGYKMEKLGVKSNPPKRYYGADGKYIRTSAKRRTYNGWNVIQFEFSDRVRQVLTYEKKIVYTDNPNNIDWETIETDIQSLLNFYTKYNYLTMDRNNNYVKESTLKHLLKIQYQIGIADDFDIDTKMQKCKKVVDLIDKYLEKNFCYY